MISISGGVDCGRVLGRRKLLAASCLLLALAWPAAASAAGWSSTGAILPANAEPNPGPFATLGSLSCGSAGDCAAVGTYQDSSNHLDGLLVTETAGIWQPAVEAVLPADASTTRPQVAIGSVSCPAAGSCSAVGDYAGPNDLQGLLLTESSGTWQPGVTATLPAGASAANPHASLSSVSCSTTGECAAVGQYQDTGLNERGLLLTESSGTWRTGVPVTPPAGADPAGPLTLSAVSCPSAGNCSAVGKYPDSAGNSQGLLLTENAGTWQAGIEASLPPAATNPGVTFSSVSCAAAGECSAVGTFDDGSGQEGLLATETAGIWQPAVEATLPAGALGSGQAVALSSVSCGAAGACSGVGTYLDSSNATQGLLVTETGGVWQPAIEASLPANAQSSPFVRLGSVSCVSSGECTAVGRYADTDSNLQELWLTESSGTWGTGVEAAPPASAGVDPEISLSAVSCTSAQACTAVGIYRDPNNGLQGLLASPLASPAVSLSAPSSGIAGAQVTPAAISASLSAGASPAGTVTFSVYGPQATPPSGCGSGGTTVGTAAASGDGTYSPSSGFTPPAAGDYWWYASYGGDTRNSSAASACGTSMPETVVTAPSGPGGGGSGGAGGGVPGGPTATSTALRSSANPAVSGQRVTYTAVVSPAPDSGTVRFLAGTQPLAGCGAVPVDPANRTATCTTSFQRPGAYQVQAIYAGDARFTVSRSTALRQSVRSSIALTGRSSGRSGKVSIAVSCARGSGGCSIGVILSTSQTLGGQHANTKARHRVTIAGAKTVRIAAGKTSKITIKLDPAGRKLIAALKKLRVKLTLSLVVNRVHILVATRALTVTRS